jgi:Flp pilus assembly protein TadG
VRVLVSDDDTTDRAAHARDERGATAVLVALLAVFLVGLSAFTVDLGQAYVSNRNLQKAADAGSLAGAQALTKFPGTCNTVASNSTARAAAHTAAVAVAKKNYPDVSWAELNFVIRCDPQLKVLLVEFGNRGTTKSNFAPVFGGPGTVTTDRSAQATVDVATVAKQGVRPLAICSTLLDPAYADKSGDFVRISFPGSGRVPPDACPVSLSGNWWLIDCPGERTGSASGLEDQIINGCPDAVSVVPGQDDASTPGSLTVVLTDACPAAPAYSEDCMSGNPGNISQGQTPAAWSSLMFSEEPALFPVFCAPPRCSAMTASGNGTNSVFPVQSLMAAYVCGYHFKSGSNGSADSTKPVCAGNPFPTAGDNSDNNYFVFKLTTIRSSGSNTESDCSLGDVNCDGGLRRTRLTQ